MSEQRIKLSIISVAYKSNTVIRKCLKSIENFNDLGEQLEIIVVDNHPFDDEAFSCISSEFPRVRYINNPGNGGFGQGNNIGVRSSTGEFLLFLNPDTEIIEPVFQFAVQQFEGSQELAAFGMILCDENGNAFKQSYGLLPEKSGRIRLFLSKILIDYFDFVPKGIYPWGADLFIRKSIFEKIGGFDEQYFLCYEEPDLIRRIPDSYTIKIFPKKILHIGGHSLNLEGTNKRLEWFFDSEQYYFNKYSLDYKKYARRMLLKLKFRQIISPILRRRTNAGIELIFDHYKSISKSG